MRKILVIIIMAGFGLMMNGEGISLTANIPNYYGFFNPNIGVEVPTTNRQSITISVYSANLMFFKGYGIDTRYRFYSDENSGFYMGPYISFYYYDSMKMFKNEKTENDNGMFIGTDLGYKAKINKEFSLGLGAIPIYNYTFSNSEHGWAFFLDIFRLNYNF